MTWRFITLIFVSTLSFLGLIVHLYDLQIKEGQMYAAQAASQYRSSGALAPRRGSIYFTDKRGERIVAVLNKNYMRVFAVPTEIEDVEEVAENLSRVLGIDVAELRQKLSKKNDSYELLQTKLTPKLVAGIEALHSKGIYIKNQESRFYPFGALAAHLIGFVGPRGEDDELKGRYGIEAKYDADLSGKLTLQDKERFSQVSEGKDILLTIDRNIQGIAEEILEKLVATHHASGGTVIVEDPKSGKILALAANPDFDPNAYGSAPLSSFLNPAVEAVYEPGSVFKVLTMAAGIDSGKITPETRYTDTGSLTLNRKTIQNWDKKAHGSVTMTEVIEKSLNTGAAFAEKTMGHETFLHYLNLFGIEEKTNIDLPGEVGGSLKSLRKRAPASPAAGQGGQDINFATASFGQGVATTPIRLIAAISALANGGVMMRPYLRADAVPEPIRQVISHESARVVTAMMVSAVKKATIAQIPHYTIAGKTGTAQVPDFKRGGYADEFIHTYTGFAPAYDPRFVILIKLDKPQGAPLAGTTVVPAFRELVQFLLNYYAIPPDNLPKEEML